MKAVDPRKLKADAAEAQARGHYRKALALYEELCERDRNDPIGPHRAGELLNRLGRSQEAIVRLRQAADLYARQGFFLKAIAVCKIILQIDPDHEETQREISGLYSKSRLQAARAPQEGSEARSNVPAPRGGAVAPIALAIDAPPEPAITLPRHLPDGVRSEERPAAEPAFELFSDDEKRELGLRPPPRPAPTAPPPRPTRSAAPAPAAASPAAPGPVAAGRKRSAAEIRGGVPRSVPLADALRAAQSVPTPPRPSAAGAPVSLDTLSLGGLLLEATHEPPPELGMPADAVEIDIDLEEAEVVAEPPPDERSRVLPRTPLFSSLEERVLREVIERIEYETYAPGETIARQGEVGDSLYVVASGEVSILHEGPPPREVGRLGEGQFFGEISVVSDFPRTATVLATRQTEVLRLSRAVIWQIIEEYPEFLTALLRFVRDRLMATLQSTSPLFLALPEGERQALAAKFRLVEVEPERVLVEQGKRNDSLFLVLAGRVALSRVEGDSHRTIGVLGPGAILGERSMLTRQPAQATVRTSTRCWILAMGRPAFSEVLMTYPTVLEYVNDLAERRESAVGRLELV